MHDLASRDLAAVTGGLFQISPRVKQVAGNLVFGALIYGGVKVMTTHWNGKPAEPPRQDQ